MFAADPPGLAEEVLAALREGFAHLPEPDDAADWPAIRRVLNEAAGRMRDNYPYAHPLYAGQMLKPPHPVARLAYALAQHVNPNNHALDGGRASSAMEREAVAEIAAMFGWRTHLGHLTSAGTMANLEALWVAREVTARPGVAASAQAHYTHSRLSGVLGVPFHPVAADDRARMDAAALEALLEREAVGTVVATLGTTATGSCDPLPAILELRRRHGFRLHIDTAYGGYFTLAGNLAPQTRAAFDLIGEADSIAIDPHKHGLQPYGCGCVLFRDPADGRVHKHDSPYTYFTSAELHLGEISLECSRAGASAVALWATQRLLPLTPGGQFARGLEACRDAAIALHARLAGDSRFLVGLEPELDIVTWAPRNASASAVSRKARALFEAAGRRDLHLALANLPADLLRGRWPIAWDQPTVACLRSCLMKPEHGDWLDAIWERLIAAHDDAGGISEA